MSGRDVEAELFAAYALDALDESDSLSIEATLATDADAADEVAELRAAAGEYAAAMTTPVAARAFVRERVLDAALGARPGRPSTAAPPREAHLIEIERLISLLRSLSTEQWTRPVDPPEFDGWTVRDVASHVSASEALAAQLLGAGVASVPEIDTGNDSRTALTRARHAQLGTADIVAELAAAGRSTSAALAAYTAAELEGDDVVWWGIPTRLSTLCILRAFEVWTHADDIRRAVGEPQLAPPAPSLLTMSSRAAEWTGLMLAVAGRSTEPAVGTLALTGPGGSTHMVQLGLEPARTRMPRFALRIDVVDYCRAVGRRIRPDDLTYDVEGDAVLARQLVDALPSLAQL
jgi:uncharacterized protein (TIGR03083 family)